MINTYHRDVIEILLAHGKEGMKLCRIARRVYNLHADLFDNDINYEEIHRELGFYMWKQSQKRESPFRRVAYGVYSLKPDIAIQLDLFLDIRHYEEPRPEEPKVPHDPHHLQLELF